MAKEQAADDKKAKITAEQVVEYVRNHPNFFKDNADLLEDMTPPEVDHGSNVVDLQHHMLGRLQQGMKSLQHKYEGLVLSSRDNMSTLHQVHQAVLALIRAPDFDRLLEVVAMDLPALFNVDVVRIGLESKAAEFYENKLAEENASGLSFLEEGLIDKALNTRKAILLVGDTKTQFIYGFEQIFAHCSGITESAALLRMRLPSLGRDALLAFGVRIPQHFQQGQGTELLTFLAQIVEHQLDTCLSKSGIDHLI